MVGVGIEGGNLHSRIFAANTNSFPVKRRRDLERNASEWSFAIVAHRDQRSNRNLVHFHPQMNVHIKRSEGDSLAFRILGRGRSRHLRLWRASLRRGLPVLIG
jgi:hypothetical protein